MKLAQRYIGRRGSTEFNTGTFRGVITINTASPGFHVQVQTSGITQGGIYAAQGVHGALTFFGRIGSPTNTGLWAGVDAAGDYVEITATAGTGRIHLAPDQLGFFSSPGGTAAVKQTVTGSRGGNAALQSLLAALAAYGLITDSTT